MPKPPIENVPEVVIEKLRERARRNHRSMQGELMALVSDAVASSSEETTGHLPKRSDASTLRARSSKSGRPFKPGIPNPSPGPRLRLKSFGPTAMTAEVLIVAKPGAHCARRMPLVADCSVIAALLFNETERDAAQSILTGHDLHAPNLIDHEIANVAVKKARQ